MKFSLRHIFITVLIVLGAGLLAFVFALRHDVVQPTPHRLIVDGANIFTGEDIQSLTEYHRMMLERYDVDIRVVTLNEPVNLNQHSYDHFHSAAVGSESSRNHGVLLTINLASDQVRLETSASLEGLYTDAFVSYIEHNQMVPFFKANRVADGVFATSELLRVRAEQQTGEGAPGSVNMPGSAGGGATVPAQINAGVEPRRDDQYPNVLATASPETTLEHLFKAYAVGNHRADLDIFTPETREFMAGMISTPAQLANTVTRYQNCEVDRVVYNEEQTRAVLLHTLANRACDPFTFVRGDDGKWRLDLKAIGLGLGHTFGNIWYIDFSQLERSGLTAYLFGFQDYRIHRPKGEQFDHQGIPYYRRWGVHINHVFEGTRVIKLHGDSSFAAKIGLKVGDLIVRWEGVHFPHSGFIQNRMGTGRAGLDVDILVKRGEATLQLLPKAPPKPSQTGQLRWGVTHNSQGPEIPFVHTVTPNAQADQLGLKPGDMILRWNSLDNPNTEAVYRAMRNARPGDPVVALVQRGNSKVELKGTAKARRPMAKVH